MRTWITVALVLIAIGGLWYLASLNAVPVGEINLYFARFAEVPLWRALVGSLVIGAALAAVILSWPLLRLKLSLRRTEKRIAQLERELHGLRTLPLTDEDSVATQAREA